METVNIYGVVRVTVVVRLVIVVMFMIVVQRVGLYNKCIVVTNADGHFSFFPDF